MRVIVVGAGLSGLTASHVLRRDGHDVTILDDGDEPGGLIRTTRIGGWMVEDAVPAWLHPHPGMMGLLDELGLADDLVEAKPTAAIRYIIHRGRLTPLPTKPQALLTSRLFSLRGRLRILRELRVPPREFGTEESVHAFATRRFGPEAAPIADAGITGIYAGDPTRLSVDHAFPDLRRMELEHGSILRATAARARERRADGGATPRLATLAGGMGSLIRALAGDVHIIPRTRVARVERHGAADAAMGAAKGDPTGTGKRGNFLVHTAGGTIHDADRVILALPPNAASPILEADIPRQTTAPAAVVALGYPRDVVDPRARASYGFLAPARENRFLLGALFESSVFPGRAPDDHVLIRAIVGGLRDPAKVGLDDDELAMGVHRDLESLGLVEAEPVFRHIARPAPIPQIELGHGRILQAQARVETEWPGIDLVGMGWRTVAAAKLVDEAESAAKRVTLAD